MYKLKKGELRTVIYNTRDLELYKQSGWSLVEAGKKEEQPKAQKENVDEQSNSKRKSIKK